MPDEYGALKSVIDLYGLAVDTQQWDLFDQIFTPDVDADWGGTAVWNNISDFKRDFAAYHDIFDRTHHVMTNMVFAVEGDRATAVTYGHWLLVRYGAPGGDVWRGEGWYNDRLVRTGNGWRISRRRCGIILSEGNTAVMDTGGAAFDLGTLSLRDGVGAGLTDVLPVLLKGERVPA